LMPPFASSTTHGRQKATGQWSSATKACSGIWTKTAHS
jgi:hypothetical protein